jgi:sugar lactone lactonase YvrE
VPPAPLALSSLTTLAEGVDHPEGICTTPDGTIYVGGEAGQIYRVGPDGAVEEVLSTGGFLLGLAADAAGRVYAIDNVRKCVWRVDPERRTKEVWAEGPPGRPFRTPNWGAFDDAGTYYLTDSGGWGTNDGLVWRVRRGGTPEVWSEELRAFPNGLCLSADASRLYVLESYPGALVEVPILPDGSAGARRLLCDLDPAVPDGVAETEDGGFLIACYRPDAVLRWHPDEGLSTFAEDVRGTVLAAPTNIAFVGERLDTAIVPNIGRWHLTRIPLPWSGVPPRYPDIP